MATFEYLFYQWKQRRCECYPLGTLAPFLPTEGCSLLFQWIRKWWESCLCSRPSRCEAEFDLANAPIEPMVRLAKCLMTWSVRLAIWFDFPVQQEQPRTSWVSTTCDQMIFWQFEPAFSWTRPPFVGMQFPYVWRLGRPHYHLDDRWWHFCLMMTIKEKALARKPWSDKRLEPVKWMRYSPKALHHVGLKSWKRLIVVKLVDSLADILKANGIRDYLKIIWNVILLWRYGKHKDQRLVIVSNERGK